MELVMKIFEIIVKVILISVGMSMVIVLIDLYFAYIRYLKAKALDKTNKIINNIGIDAISEIIKFQANQSKNNK